MRCRGTWEDICFKRGDRGAIGYSRLIRWFGGIPLRLGGDDDGNLQNNRERNIYSSNVVL